jgi:16S rRNA (guanine966-N2)-methyltransferase
MIRIGAGTLAGRIIEQPKTTKTRPLTSKARASMFNRLGDLTGLSVLDAYAGSGAFGIEAASHGADKITFIEQSRPVAQVIERNCADLAVSGTTVIVKSVYEAVKGLKGQSFDIILADPPYSKLNEEELEKLFYLLVEDGIGIVSHWSRATSPQLTSADLIDARTYGDTTISYYRGKIG